MAHVTLRERCHFLTFCDPHTHRMRGAHQLWLEGATATVDLWGGPASETLGKNVV